MSNKVRRLNKNLSYRSYLQTFYKPTAEVIYNWDVSKESMQAAKVHFESFAAASNGIRPFGTPEEETKLRKLKGSRAWELLHMPIFTVQTKTPN